MEERCRACLSKESLFCWDEIVGEDFSYADMFYHITSLNENNLQHHKWLCDNCGRQIREIYKFIKKAAIADKALSQEIHSKGLLKQKPESDKNETEGLSVEIRPLTEEEFRCQIDTEALINDKDDSNLLKDVDENETSGRIKSYEHKFEIVELEGQNVDFDEEFSQESKNSFINEQDELTQDDETNCFVRENCGKKYSSSLRRKKHLATDDSERFLCDVCHRTFRKFLNLKKHKMTHNENRPRDYACDRCELRFLTMNALKSHREIHDDKREKRYQCDQCEKAFFQKGALNVHKRIHTGNMVQCEICEKRYPRLVDLEIHMRSHTGEQPFKCTTCGKAFKYASTLYNHLRKAHFGYIYKCTLCSKQYKEKQSLVEHSKIHKTSKFKCALCDKEMIRKYRLKCHIKVIHNIDNPEELEQLVISCKAENKPRIMRNFTNIEYKDHIAQPVLVSRPQTCKWLSQNVKNIKQESTDGSQEGQQLVNDPDADC